MHLQLDRPAVPLQDGSASWNASAADALATWNEHIASVKFVQAPPANAAPHDGSNAVFFATSIYGDSFGNQVLAVTVNYSTGSSTFTETDVIFNNARKWNSYRGPRQGDGSSATFDLHRVALHEFGHVLGLDHPDERGQYGREALMNSIISDLDHLSEDDVAGARALYGLKITSPQHPQFVRSGDQFSYQITADNNPVNFSATGLPQGLQVNTATGLISGSCPISGVFIVELSVQGGLGPATGRFQLFVNPLPLTSVAYPPIVLIGDHFSYQVTAANNPANFSATGLPAGATIDPNSGLISGTPTATGRFSVTVTARGAASEAQGTIYLEVSPPMFTHQSNPRNVNLGDNFTFQITATHNPSSFTATGLPPGFEINPSTGIITGTATVAGSFYVTVTAETAYGRATGYVGITISPPHITSSLYLYSVPIGEDFLYQIQASNHPTSFSAIGLPAGLQLDEVTGIISGVPNLSGHYQVQLTARGAVGDASNYLSIIVDPEATFNPSAAKIPLPGFAGLLADPARPRLYAAGSDMLVILDAASFAVLKSLPLIGGSSNMEISADGTKLYVCEGYPRRIKCLNLNTLEFLPDIIATGRAPWLIKEGADGRLYITDSEQNGVVFQIDPVTGTTLGQFSPFARSGYIQLAIELSPDRKTLFVAETQRISPLLAKYSLVAGGAPVLVQQIDAAGPNSSIGNLTISPDGQVLAFASRASGTSEASPLRSTDDLNVMVGGLPVNGFVDEIAFSPDGLLAIQTYSYLSQIDVIEVATRKLIRTITLPPFVTSTPSQHRRALAISNTNSHLFFATTNGYSSSDLYVYPLSSTPPQPKSLLNVATRLRAQTGDDVLIGGFIITGTEPKKVILRAIGPSLPLTGKLADPQLELRGPGGTLVAHDDNWNSHRADVLATGVAPLDEREAAIVATLQPGAYTALLRGTAGTSGVALVELYDLTPASTSRIANISTRGKVETGDNVMIGGFIIGGDQLTKVIVRAIGPSLAERGVTGPLSDTTLALHDGHGAVIAQNDDWRSDQPQEIIASTVPPTDEREAAIVRTLQPGNYTAIVRGKNETTGVALVEVYNLEPN